MSHTKMKMKDKIHQLLLPILALMLCTLAIIAEYSYKISVWWEAKFEKDEDEEDDYDTCP